jgi:RHS repeat-associated protein
MERFFVRGAGIAEGTGDVLAEIRGSDANSATAVFYVVNHRGDTLNVYVYGTGLIASYRYDAFGNVIGFSCATGHTNLLPRYTFSTKEYLPDAKVYLYAYRVYDPVAGRWTQRDPIDYQDSVNLYQFCQNRGVNSFDVDGRFVYSIPLAIVIGVIGDVIITEIRVYSGSVTAAVPVSFPFITFHGPDYYSLSEAARYAVDAHEDRHHGYRNRFDDTDDEIPAHQVSYEVASTILKSGKFNGRKLTEDERIELKAIKQQAKSELKKRMKPEEYKEWRKKHRR